MASSVFLTPGVTSGGGIVTVNGLVLNANTPSPTTSTLYSPDGSALYFNGTLLATGSAATTQAITNDTTTNATMYPTWVTATTGDLPVKVSSTKLTFNPSTGALTLGGGPLTTQNVEMYRTTTNALYVQTSSGLGIDANATTSGTSIRGRTVSGVGVAGQSLSNSAVSATQTGNLTGNTTNPALLVSRDHVLGAFTSTGALISGSDTSGSTARLMRLAYGGADKFEVAYTGNVTSAGTIRATAQNGALTVTGGDYNSAVYGSFGVGSDPHGNVLFHVLNVDFTPSAGATTAYGAVIYPNIIALDPFSRLTGLMVGPTWRTPATSSISEVSSVYLPVNAITDGGGGSIGTGATLLIDGAPTFAATKTDGLYAIKVKAGLSYFGGGIGGTEQTAPSAPPANEYRLYAEDNGGGKTRLMCLFASGAAQQVAIQP